MPQPRAEKGTHEQVDRQAIERFRCTTLYLEDVFHNLMAQQQTQHPQHAIPPRYFEAREN
nr:hypothetical protein [Chryseosolibacter histidini]